MRTTIEMVKVEQTMQAQLRDMIHEILKRQLPDLVEDVVQRNTSAVISSVDESSTRSLQDLEARIRDQVLQEINMMLESASNDVVGRVGTLLAVEAPF